MKNNMLNYISSDKAKVLIIAGENGSGKSRYLKQIAETFSKSKSVTIVCNTVFDRFQNMDHIAKISVADGRNITADAIKRVLNFAFHESNPLSYKPIAQVLGYCGYSKIVGIKVEGMASTFKDKILNSPDVPKLTRSDLRELDDAYTLFKENKGRITWIDLANSDPKSGYIHRSISVLIKHEKLLVKIDAIKSINLYLAKEDVQIPLDESSSGELTLIATRVFLATTIQENEIILIDEPENSLHPLWQREYISQLLDILYLKQPTIVIATHSPIIVSTGQIKEEDKSAVEIGIFKIENENLVKVEDNQSEATSVEDTYWKVFNTVTPVNHFVSEVLVAKLNDLAKGNLTLNELNELINNLDQASYDPVQKEFFIAVKALAQKIHAEEVSEINNARFNKEPD